MAEEEEGGERGPYYFTGGGVYSDRFGDGRIINKIPNDENLDTEIIVDLYDIQHKSVDTGGGARRGSPHYEAFEPASVSDVNLSAKMDALHQWTRLIKPITKFLGHIHATLIQNDDNNKPQQSSDIAPHHQTVYAAYFFYIDIYLSVDAKLRTGGFVLFDPVAINEIHALAEESRRGVNNIRQLLPSKPTNKHDRNAMQVELNALMAFLGKHTRSQKQAESIVNLFIKARYAPSSDMVLFKYMKQHDQNDYASDLMNYMHHHNRREEEYLTFQYGSKFVINQELDNTAFFRRDAMVNDSSYDDPEAQRYHLNKESYRDTVTFEMRGRTFFGVLHHAADNKDMMEVLIHEAKHEEEVGRRHENLAHASVPLKSSSSHEKYLQVRKRFMYPYDKALSEERNDIDRDDLSEGLMRVELEAFDYETSPTIRVAHVSAHTADLVVCTTAGEHLLSFDLDDDDHRLQHVPLSSSERVRPDAVVRIACNDNIVVALCAITSQGRRETLRLDVYARERHPVTAEGRRGPHRLQSMFSNEPMHGDNLQRISRRGGGGTAEKHRSDFELRIYDYESGLGFYGGVVALTLPMATVFYMRFKPGVDDDDRSASRPLMFETESNYLVFNHYERVRNVRLHPTKMAVLANIFGANDNMFFEHVNFTDFHIDGNNNPGELSIAQRGAKATVRYSNAANEPTRPGTQYRTPHAKLPTSATVAPTSSGVDGSVSMIYSNSGEFVATTNAERTDIHIWRILTQPLSERHHELNVQLITTFSVPFAVEKFAFANNDHYLVLYNRGSHAMRVAIRYKVPANELRGKNGVKRNAARSSTGIGVTDLEFWALRSWHRMIRRGEGKRHRLAALRLQDDDDDDTDGIPM